MINVASRLFRARGFDGIGLKDLMEAAGTDPRRLLQAVRVKRGSGGTGLRRAHWRAPPCRWSTAIAANPRDPLGAVMAFYLSPEHREEKMDGCPIVALGSDAARQSSDVKAPFEAGIKAHLEILNGLIAETNAEERNGKAMAVLSTMVGAQTLARVVNDPDLAQALLEAAAEQVREAVAA